jgi:hypothetical protein
MKSLTPYDEEPTSRGFEDSGEGGSDRDMLYDQCVAFVLETRKASTSSLQRKFSLGYNRAARIIDQMEENGIVMMGANGKRNFSLIYGCNRLLIVIATFLFYSPKNKPNKIRIHMIEKNNNQDNLWFTKGFLFNDDNLF